MRDWKTELEEAFQEKSRRDALRARQDTEVAQFLLYTAAPALTEVASVLTVHGRNMKVQRSNGSVQATVTTPDGKTEFRYGIIFVPTETGIRHHVQARRLLDDEAIVYDGPLSRDGADAPLGSITKEIIINHFVAQYSVVLRGLRRP